MKKLMFSGLAILFATCLSNGSFNVFADTYQSIEKNFHGGSETSILAY